MASLHGYAVGSECLPWRVATHCAGKPLRGHPSGTRLRSGSMLSDAVCAHSAPADGFGVPGKHPVLPAARRGLAIHEESTLPTLLTQL